MERKTTAPYAKHWHFSNIHPLDPFFLQLLQRTCSILLSFSQFVTQDISQAFVPAPLTLLLYINDLASTLNDDAVITLFPDDVSILTTAAKKEDAVAAVQ